MLNLKLVTVNEQFAYSFDLKTEVLLSGIALNFNFT